MYPLQKIYLLFTFICLIGVSPVLAQNGVNQVIDLTIEEKPLIQVLYDLSKNYELNFFFEPQDLPYFPLTEKFEQKPIYAILQKLIDGTNLLVLPYADKGLAIVDKRKLNAAYLQELVGKWEDGSYGYPFDEKAKQLSYSFGQKSTATENVKLVISLMDETSGEPIIGAVVATADLSINGVSDPDGKVQLDLISGTYTLLVSYVGYQSIELQIDVFANASIDLVMSFQSFLFEEIEVVANSIEQKLKDSEVGKEVINIKKLESIPQVLGELDILKSLETLPGVTTAGELSAGINVRGGDVDESLVLLNDGIIFNPTHIVGFISAFNADALDNATLYKSYVDPAYGGRGAAILDLQSTAADAKEFKGSGGVGTSMMKLFVEGPVTEKLKFQASVRGSFNDFLLGLIANVELQKSNARFYDFNGGLTYQVNEAHQINWNAYLSNDFFEYNDEFGFRWTNAHLGLQWKSNWSERLFSSLSLNYGSYGTDNFTIGIPDAASFKAGLSYLKGIAAVNRKIGLDGFVKVGMEYLDFSNQPDRLEPTAESTLTAQQIQRKAGASFTPFITFNQKIGEKITFETGLRWANYYSTGAGKIFEYEDGIKTENTIIDQMESIGRDAAGTHQVLEPRASVNFNFKANWSVKAAYNRMSQNMIQLSNTNTTLPSDLWIFTNRYLEPLVVDQYSLGLFSITKNKNLSMEMDVFSKNMQGLYELDNFSQIVLNEHIETELIAATGRSYGLEFLLKKPKGKWTGSLAYTYSRSLRTTIEENKSINNNEEFPADFDIPHQLNVLASYRGLPVVSFNFAYVYKSGRPTTVPSGTIIQDGFVIPLYSFKNQERIPFYSRLDFSIALDLRQAKQKGFRNSFSLGFYNLLGRRNATNVFFRRSSKGNIVPFQFAVVGAVIPNLSWNFVF